MISPIALRLLTLLALSASALCACAPAPVPSPTPSPVFESEEEAFAAAEATFTEYTKATNRTDLAVPSTFEAVYVWLARDAKTSAKENYSRLHADGITRTGTSRFDGVRLLSYSRTQVTLRLCLDVSDVALTRSDGTSAVPADRPPRQPVEVEFVPRATVTGLAISSIIASEVYKCES